MKLIKQTSLAFRRGSSDKVYEVDLCEVGDDQFVVNFRYGRRGATLRDGSKTPLPVGRAEADKIFDKLVTSKTSKGYIEVDDIGAMSAPPPAPEPSAPAPPTSTRRASPPEAGRGGAAGPYRGGAAPAPIVDARGRAVLERLRAGDRPTQRQGLRRRFRDLRSARREGWSLDRAIWRAGELGLREAESTLIELLRGQRGAPLRRYCIVWALGRVGSEASIPLLRTLYESSSERDNIRALAAEALRRLYSDADRRRFIDGLIDSLPQSLRQPAREGPAEAFEDALSRQLRGSVDAKLLATIYLIDNEHTRPGLLEALSELPVDRKAHKWIRRLFKAAEFRRDGRVYGLLAHRIEKDGRRHLRARDYYRRRVWRALRNLGEVEVEQLSRADHGRGADQGTNDFVRLAVGVLLAFEDGDAQQPRSYDGYQWHWGPWAGYWAFNQLLYRHSDRFQSDGVGKAFRAWRRDSHEQRISRREEAFPALWDAAPAGLLQLLDESECEPVHQFAATALRANRAFCAELAADAVVMLLSAPYEVTAELGFDLAERLYDPTAPDLELIAGCACCAYEPARRVAKRWIDADRGRFTQSAELMAQLVLAPYDDTRRYARDLLRGATLPAGTARTLIARVIAALIALNPDLDDEDADAAALVAKQREHVVDVVDTLLRALRSQLGELGHDVLRDLAAHVLPELQILAGEILLIQGEAGKRAPDDLVMALLAAEAAAPRTIAVRLLGQLPDGELSQRPELLFSIATHEHADLRGALRPVLGRLATSQPAFAERFCAMLVEALCAGGLPDGVPTSLVALLREELLGALPKVDEDGIWRLLHSPLQQAKELGGVLLARDIDPSQLSIKQLVSLASHEILSVRQAIWRLCEADIERLKRGASQAVRIVDAKWADTRQWAFGFIRDHFGPEELTPKTLVAITDSVRDDVQAFGRELITRFFSAEHGADYLLKLAEHPAEGLQLYASNYLERFAAGNIGHLQRLEPYFVSVLSRVNKGRVAKTRVLTFLEAEATKSAEAAELVARIFARQSVTIAVGDKAKLIEGMLVVHREHPAIELPITLKPVVSRAPGSGAGAPRPGVDDHAV